MAEWPVIAPKPPAVPEAPTAPFTSAVPWCHKLLKRPKPSSHRVCPRWPRQSAAPVAEAGRRQGQCGRTGSPVVSRHCDRAEDPVGSSRARGGSSRAGAGLPCLPSEECARTRVLRRGDASRAVHCRVSGAWRVPTPGVSALWRIAALLFALVAASEGGFIAWRLASSPSGLMGTNGTLKVESKPMGAQVKIDGEVRDITPLSLSIAGGAHVMEIAAGTDLASFPSPLPPARRSRSTWSWSESPPWDVCRFSLRRLGQRCCSTANPEASHPWNFRTCRPATTSWCSTSRDSACARWSPSPPASRRRSTCPSRQPRLSKLLACSPRPHRRQARSL